ncbi:MAG: hypothetical protein R2784_04515 [Saprospiraceae bacterium]
MQKAGIFLFTLAALIFISLVTISPKKLTLENLDEQVGKTYHREMIKEKTEEAGLLGKDYSNQFEFIPELKSAIKSAQKSLEEEAKIEDWKATNIPEGVNEWDFRMGDGDVDAYVFSLSKAASSGFPAKKVAFCFG